MNQIMKPSLLMGLLINLGFGSDNSNVNSEGYKMRQVCMQFIDKNLKIEDSYTLGKMVGTAETVGNIQISKGLRPVKDDVDMTVFLLSCSSTVSSREKGVAFETKFFQEIVKHNRYLYKKENKNS